MVESPGRCGAPTVVVESPSGAHERNGHRPQNRAKGRRPKNRSTQKRKVKLSGCPVRALFWLAAPVSFSSGAVLPAWSGRVPAPVSFSSGAALLARSFRVPFCVPVLFLVRLLALSWLRFFCFVSFRCPEVVEMFEVQTGADPITELSTGTPRGRYGRNPVGISYFWRGTVVLVVSGTFRVFPWLV